MSELPVVVVSDAVPADAVLLVTSNPEHDRLVVENHGRYRAECRRCGYRSDWSGEMPAAIAAAVHGSTGIIVHIADAPDE